ncbi:MAG: type II toxin-antitoxin system RelE/ParE family toxin [Candidatus Dormibacteraceae bacterium]
MKLDWEEEALQDLNTIVDWAPKAAIRIVDEMEWLAGSPFPGMHRRLKDWPDNHACGIPPYIVFYIIREGYLVVTGIIDTRRHREPLY